MEDNVYPNDGGLFDEVINTEEAQKADKNDIAAEYPKLKQVFDRLEERIAFYDTLSAISDDVTQDPVQFMNTVAANKLVKQNLEQEFLFIKSLIGDVIK